MGTVSTSLPSDGTTIDASDVNTPINAILSEFNGNIDDNNIKSGANINGSKILAASLSGSKLDSTTAGGWIASGLPAVSSVTENGNRSADITFASTVASLLTPGMRLRTSRTVAAPTGAISLNGTTQYASKASPTGVGATDDYTFMGWVKLSAYQNGWVVSKLNAAGNSGKGMQINSSGQVVVGSYNVAPSTRLGTSYQSLPLNKWVHVAATVDASAGSILIYFDGVLVPSSTTGAAVAATDAGNLEVGSYGGGLQPIAGNLAQVAVFSAVLSASTIRSYKNQTLSGSETNCVAAYKLDQASGLNDLTANANNLTATGSPTYSTASPFTTDANGTASGTYDWAIVQKVATTVATVQYPEGCAIPTSGGISTVDYSGVKAPFGMPIQRERWRVKTILRFLGSQNTPTQNQWYNLSSTSGTSGGSIITIPTGDWDVSYKTQFGHDYAATGVVRAEITLSTANNTESDDEFTTSVGGQTFQYVGQTATTPPKGITNTSQTTYYLNTRTTSAGVQSILNIHTENTGLIIAEPTHL